ncbi:hypothetical protein [Streptomyces sp. NPDC056160]|uniref:hypothetical protein n=1 Tax=Streptomyces sp. NPDC056160 TaxID=3345731 RepID=UPI0035D7B0B9
MSRTRRGHRSGAAHQKFVRDRGTVRPSAATGPCLTQATARQPPRLRNCDGSAGQRFAP